jgi:thiamine pyrophosphate-dependent acetolactate synthase large subunit-like protein
MNEFEKKLFADLQAGHSMEDLLSEFQKHLDEAKKEHDALEAKKKADEDAKAKAQANREANAKRITEVANRMLNNTITSEDVAWMFQRYFATKWTKSDAVLESVMTAHEVDQMVDTAIKLFDGLEPVMKIMDMSWDQIGNDLKSDSMKVKAKEHKRSDDDIIKDFIQKVL